jgi:energy coupling factor transporter S component ThiW
MMETRKVARAVILVAIGVALSPMTSIPIGIARINPTQHFINVVAAVLLGPWWATGIALAIGAIRNALGTGTLLAFPGGMIGAFLAGWLYRITGKRAMAVVGEVAGTGILGSLASALLVSPVLMGKSSALGVLMIAFSGSTVAGSILGLAALRLLDRAGFLPADPRRGRPTN